MVKHPIDRILTVYSVCQENATSILCHFNRLNVQNMTLHQFIKVQGSSFFRKLLYYSKHCRLVGRDEICLPDSKTSFVLTSRERRVYLENILENLEKWFAVVGLEEYFEESLSLFESVSGLNYTDCSKLRRRKELVKTAKSLWPVVSSTGGNTLSGFQNMSELHNMPNVTFQVLREKLIRDPQVSKWLSADMAIYTKLEELFKKQLELYNISKSVMKTLQSPAIYSTLPSSLKLKRKKITKDKRGSHGKNKIDNGRHPQKKGGHELKGRDSHGLKQETKRPASSKNQSHTVINGLSDLEKVTNLSKDPPREHNKSLEEFKKVTLLSRNDPRSREKIVAKKGTEIDDVAKKIQFNYDRIKLKRERKIHKRKMPIIQAHGANNVSSKTNPGFETTTVASNKPGKKRKLNNKEENHKSGKNRKKKRKGGFLYKQADSSARQFHKKKHSKLQ